MQIIVRDAVRKKVKIIHTVRVLRRGNSRGKKKKEEKNRNIKPLISVKKKTKKQTNI